jgi:hypothetical protein
MLVGVPYHEAYGATGGATLKDSAEQLHLVLLLACRSKTALPWASACKFALNEIKVHFYAGRHAINNTTYSLAMALAKGGKSEYIAKCIHFVKRKCEM